MSNGFYVEPSELSRISAALSTAAGQTGEAGSAGAAVTALSPQAFGIICSFFTPPCLAFSSAALTAIGAIEGALGKGAGAVDACSADFQKTDAAVAQMHDKLRGTL
ncbi:type VII secretion target [Nocardioides sp. zg-1228]|uniref:type VII secretion target n=1 Tax=Nocardioides sp. zg-1228 TaxID=2763008 RepID=UPI0016423FD8|nr:type VII secretion target [Nocardioides sp. zg-1228]MBC2932292.1 hypothetical protein [Nocardioides sp. zg-1228]QSF57813.1 hypothetical protein JX575_00805 [Nocardioides sp. zg-1228]